MNDDMSIGLTTGGFIILGIIAVIALFLMRYGKAQTFLKRNRFLAEMPGTLLWISLWCVGKEFVAWWLAGIIAVAVTSVIALVLRKRNTPQK